MIWCPKNLGETLFAAAAIRGGDVMRAERDPFWDAVKGVGYLFVLCGHMVWTRYIYNFHMPLFFIVSGMFFDVSRGGGRILRNIAVPMFYFYLIALVYNLVRPCGVDFHKLLLTTYQGVPYINAPIWFLISLGIVQLLSLRLLPWLNLVHYRKFWNTLLLGLCAVLGYGISLLPMEAKSHIPLVLGTAPMALFFFVFGHWLRGWLKNRLRHLQLVVAVPLFALLLVGYCLVSYRFGYSDMRLMTFNTLPSFVVTSLMGSACVVLFVRLFCFGPLLSMLSWIGRCSIAFFLVEWCSVHVVVNIVRPFGSSVWFPVFCQPTTADVIGWKILIAVLAFGLSCLAVPPLMCGLKTCKAFLGKYTKVRILCLDQG